MHTQRNINTLGESLIQNSRVKSDENQLELTKLTCIKPQQIRAGA